MSNAKKEYYKLCEESKPFGGLLSEITDYISELENELAALRERTRWISVEEKLPENSIWCLAYDLDDSLLIVFYDKSKNKFYGEVMAPITHWQLMSEGPTAHKLSYTL